MSKDFKQAMEERRSIYGICSENTVSNERVLEIVKNSTKYVPTAFNSQSTRIGVLFGEKNKKMWKIVMDTLKEIVPPDKFAPTEEKINGFAAGCGTLLFFDEKTVTQGLADEFEAYKDNFPIWAEQANGMLQFAIWTQLEAEGLGVNLQHYNPIIDAAVKKEFNIPDAWRLIAQMPFGKPTALPGEKEFVPIEERVLVL